MYRMQLSIRSIYQYSPMLFQENGLAVLISSITRSGAACGTDTGEQLAGDRGFEGLSIVQFCCAQNRRHCVFLPGCQIDGCGQDIARLDTEELRPFAIA